MPAEVAWVLVSALAADGSIAAVVVDGSIAGDHG